MGGIDQGMNRRCRCQQGMSGDLHHIKFPQADFFLNRQGDHIDELSGGSTTHYLAAQDNARTVGRDQLYPEHAGTRQRTGMVIRRFGGGSYIAKTFFFAGPAGHSGTGKGYTTDPGGKGGDRPLDLVQHSNTLKVRAGIASLGGGC